ncbi:MAG: CatB-related O-acetyltransferase [Planctomycetota bacterium]|nr:CatB-related O-acetyltransferase [Planctomycetota bacterium]
MAAVERYLTGVLAVESSEETMSTGRLTSGDTEGLVGPVHDGNASAEAPPHGVDEPRGQVTWHEKGLKQSRLSDLLVKAYGFQVHWLRQRCLKLALRLEDGQFHSATIRRILARYYRVRVGAYSYGDCLVPGAFPENVSVGRYVSVAMGVRIIRRNHPTDCLSTHPFFFNSRLGYLKADNLPVRHLEIGHDVWIGTGAVVTPGCSRIGIGAIIGAGAIVTRDVADFAIVVGNPAKALRYRFPEAVRGLILKSRWWELPAGEVAAFMAQMTRPLGDDPWWHPLLAKCGNAAGKN